MQSGDVTEYPMKVSPKDVQLSVLENIEYKDNMLLKCSGKMILSMDRAKSLAKAEKDYSNVLETGGSYTMQQKTCTDYSSSNSPLYLKMTKPYKVEKSLLATIDTGKSWLDVPASCTL